MKISSPVLWRRGGGLLLFAVFVLGLVLWRSSGQADAPGSVYLTAPVIRGTLQRSVSSTGTLAAVETVTVGTEVSGTVAKVLVDYNDRVSQGEVLAILKPDLFNSAVAEAQGVVDQAEASLEQTKADLDRNRPLYEKGYLSTQEFLPYRTSLDKATAALASALANLKRARINLANATINSPIAGTVIQRSIDAGQTVAASLNTPTLFVIARDLARMQIEAAVDETDIGQIRPGQNVSFSVQSYPEQTFSGKVLQVRLQPTTVQNVVTYTVIVTADNDGGLLLPGMTATVDFIVEEVKDALLVPNAALRFRPQVAGDAGDTAEVSPGKGGAGSRLYRLSTDGGLQSMAVNLGSTDGQQTVISTDGLPVGTLVVTGLKPDTAKPKASFSLFGAMRGGRR